MAALSRLGRQVEEIIATLRSIDARFALIGALAFASHKVVRAVRDMLPILKETRMRGSTT